MELYVDYIEKLARHLHVFLTPAESELAIYDIKNIITVVLGVNDYSDCCERRYSNPIDWRLMLTDEFSMKVSRALSETCAIDFTGGVLLCMKRVITDAVMMSVPIPFTVSDLFMHDFSPDDDDEISQKKRREIIKLIILPIVKNTSNNRAFCLGDIYKFIDLDVVYETLLRFDDLRELTKTRIFMPFLKNYSESTCTFSETARMQWWFILRPFHDVPMLFEWIFGYKNK